MDQNMLRSSLVVIALTLVPASFGRAQTPDPAASMKPPSPEEMQKSMGTLMDGMVPTMGRMTSVVIEAQLAEAEKPETAERIATFKRNLFDALVRKGFTREQALNLTSTTPLPGGTSGGK